MAHGSMRRRGQDSWELRVYQGIDRTTGRQRWITKTVHGTQRFARRQLEDLLVEVGKGRIRSGTLADLLEQWFDAASPGWAAPTVSHTRSIIDCHLKPDLGHLDVVKLTTEDIDDYYGHLLGRGGRDGGPLARGTVTRIHGVLHRALAQAVRWEWMWSNPAMNATPPRPGPAEIRPPSPRQVALLLESVRNLNPPLHCYLRLAPRPGLGGASSSPFGGATSTRSTGRSPSAGPSCRGRTARRSPGPRRIARTEWNSTATPIRC